MDSKAMTPGEAWEDFFRWVKLPENWRLIDRRGRDRIGKAQRRYLSNQPAPLGAEGVASLLNDYAPGMWEVKWVFRRKG